ncbi:MAG: type II toxin-antitoxin system Phd/YefM family antitoxin [Spirochaetaceae bacterium]|nr:MAG: type II toxin-antitoxin system Phd/YefM family antitoxin [Spirochaetaceae bacterium]
MKRVPKSEFKPKAFEYFRVVESDGEPIMVTDHGRDAVQISPAQQAGRGSAAGALEGAIMSYEQPEAPVAENDWELLQ